MLVPTTVDLVTLFEESIDGCWVGHCARTLVAEESSSAIGSLYSPPESDSQLPKMHVETIVDIGRRAEVRCSCCAVPSAVDDEIFRAGRSSARRAAFAGS